MVITDESIGVFQLLGGTCPSYPPKSMPKGVSVNWEAPSDSHKFSKVVCYLGRGYFNMYLITISAVVKSKLQFKKVNCAV